jgi:hypothetical protein
MTENKTWRPPPLPRSLKNRVWKHAKAKGTTMASFLTSAIEQATSIEPTLPNEVTA